MTIHSRSRKLTTGYTLIELMIAITLGLILLVGVATIFVQNNRSFNEIDRANQQVENGRYALQIMTDDLSNAGYLAEFNPNLITTTPTEKPDACAVDIADLKTALPFAIQGYDNQNASDKPSCISDVRDDTDIIVVRRASNCAIGETDCDTVVAGAPYIQASTCGSSAELSSSDVTNFYKLDTNTANLTLHKKDCNPPTTAGTVAPYHRFLTHIYFIAKNDKPGDGIPTLKRAELDQNGFNSDPVSLVNGIENMQIEYGIDEDVNGTPKRYTADPDSLNSCSKDTTPPCTTYWRNTVAVKLYLLVRSTTTSPGYSSDKTYNLGLKSDGSTNTVGPFTSTDERAYKRHVYQSVVRLNNVAGRNTP
nr:PilW family protein [uncultured Tolumonas sp.]